MSSSSLWLEAKETELNLQTELGSACPFTKGCIWRMGAAGSASCALAPGPGSTPNNVWSGMETKQYPLLNDVEITCGERSAWETDPDGHRLCCWDFSLGLDLKSNQLVFIWTLSGRLSGTFRLTVDVILYASPQTRVSLKTGFSWGRCWRIKWQNIYIQRPMRIQRSNELWVQRTEGWDFNLTVIPWKLLIKVFTLHTVYNCTIKIRLHTCWVFGPF